VASDVGSEVWSILTERAIEHVLLVGVHTNMCVLGRPFGLRQLSALGKNVALVRDMTDTMYSPARAPWVPHCEGNRLVCDYIERTVCPTITSDAVLGGQPFAFAEADLSRLGRNTLAQLYALVQTGADASIPPRRAQRASE
jgi:hypothetical protein